MRRLSRTHRQARLSELFAIRVVLVIAAIFSVSCVAVSDPSCWQSGYAYEDCCAPEHGPDGLVECWDDVYTFEVCCGDTGSELVLGCRGPYFSHLARITEEYYATGRVHSDLIRMYPQVLANFDTRYQLCAPGALQSFLLQLEERAALEPTAELFARQVLYTELLHEGARKGIVPEDEMRRWPLSAGLLRIRETVAKRETAMRRRPPSVALVVSYCREPLRWMNESLSWRVMRGVDLVLVQKCAGVDVLAAVPHRRRWRSVEVLLVEDLPLQADECSAYLGFLAEWYDHLPEHVVFAHADAPEHIQMTVGGQNNILEDALRAVLAGVDVPFAHLAHNRVTMRWDMDAMPLLWRGLFRSSVVPGPQAVKTYCCSHFVVSRKRIVLRPQEFYTNALRFLMSPESYEYLPATPHVLRRDLDSQHACQMMMFLWHVIFGADLDLPHRKDDADLPLFLKVRNLKLSYLDYQR